MSASRYRLAPGLEIVRLGPDRFFLRSEFAAFELTGASATDLVERLLRRLDEPATIDDMVGRMEGYSAAAIEREVGRLHTQGVLMLAPETDRPANPGLSNFLYQAGLGGEGLRRLRERRVAVFGLEAHGAHLALLLAQIGVGRLVLVDPFELRAGHLPLVPAGHDTALGTSRQEAVANLLAGWETQVAMPVTGPFGREAVFDLTRECDVVVGCFDRAFSAAHLWINEASLKSGIPALYGNLRAAGALAGPFVVPERSACYLCYRMRAIACEPNFERAMALEEHLDTCKDPRLDERPILPGLPAYLAVQLGLDILRHLTGMAPARLVDRVLEFDAIGSTFQDHRLLVKPDCPACGPLKKKTRKWPKPGELTASPDPSEDRPDGADRLARELVSPHCGVVREFGAVSRDPSEPSRPHVWRATLANHRFLPQLEDSHILCSGKGFDMETARLSALGEAVERYSGGSWAAGDLGLGRASDLDGPVVDPRELVLYAPEQYGSIPYAPYDEDAPIHWMPAWSLTGDEEVFVPAVSALIEYEVPSHAEFLFPITSNGLATGPSPARAVLGALYEVLERDAFLIAWCNELPGTAYPAGSHPDREVRNLAVAYERRGVRLDLIDLPTDHPVHVVFGMARQQRGEGPAVVVGLGADLDLCEAARRAALEVGQVRPGMRRRAFGDDAGRVKELAEDPTKVKTLDDHALLYCHPSRVGAFEFLERERQTSWPVPERIATGPALERLLRHFRETGVNALFVNLTPPDMESLDLHTVRAIVPGFQPIWFGRGERRLGGSRMFEFPVRMGFRPSPRTLETLNPLPHPLA